MDELLQQVAQQRGMPASLVERSAQAKADKTGTTLEAVLREWAGEAADDEPAPAQAAAPDAPSPNPGESSISVPAPPVITTDYLVQLAADAKRMPPKLILSSAQARAEHSGTQLETVLADWAGVDLDELKAAAAASTPSEAAPVTTAPAAPEPAPAQPPAEPAPAEAAAPAAAVAAVAATALTMDQLLEKVSEVKGMPAPLAKRSAEARSKKTGEPVEAVLAEWAGIDPASVTTAPAAEPAAPAEPTPAEAASAATQEAAADDVEIIEASPFDTSDVPETDEELPAKRGGYPIWLAAAFILIPLLAVVYILVSPNGPDCGSAGQLLVDPATGEAVNCDGSPYGVETVDNFAAGGSLYQQCAACHSDNGSGGVGPAFSAGAILVTFPAGACDSQIEWVSLGTGGWPESTYGATDKPVGGAGLMPAFGVSLTEEQVAQVALYERVAFGGQDLGEAEVDCGLVEAES